MAERTQINKVVVIGTLTEVDTQVRSTADGRNYISGKAIVKVEQPEADSLIEVRIFSFEKTQAGADNKLYASYKNLESMLNKRVRVQGSLQEQSFVKQDGSLQKYNTIALRFVSLARTDEEDCATFEYSGFVVKSIYERRNKDDELLGYRLEVAQSTYGENIQILKFDIDARDVNIQSAIETYYTVGSTVEFSGVINHITRIEQVEEPQAFGDPVIKKYVTNEKTYLIKSGKEVLDESNPLAYTIDEIRTKIEAYKAADVARIEKARMATTQPEAPQTDMAAMTKSKLRSLI